jgi:tight adherence protein B
MRLLAASASALFAALLVGALLGVLPRFPVAAQREPQVGHRQQWLTQAGLEVTPRQFLLGSVGAGAIGFALFFVVTGVWSVSIVPSVLVGLFPRLYFGRVRERRLAEVARAWPDGLRDLVASISSGSSLSRAIEEMTQTGPEPLRRAFARYPHLSRSLGTVPALEVIREELADPTSDRVIEVLIVASERGGGIVPEILRDLAAATTRDIWTLEEIHTQTLEQKINARAVFALPWLVLVVITLQDGAFRSFYRSAAGTTVVVVGALMSGFGIWLASRMAREPDEPRVFGGSERVSSP